MTTSQERETVEVLKDAEHILDLIVSSRSVSKAHNAVAQAVLTEIRVLLEDLEITDARP